MFVFLKDMCNMLWPWQSALCKPLHSIPSSWYDRKSRITVTRDCLFNMLVVCLCIYLLDKCVRWCFMVPATSTARKISRHEAIWRERGSPSTCFESQLAQNLEWRSALSTLAALAHWVLFTSVWSAKFFALLTSNVLHGFSTTKQNVAGWLEARKVEGSWTCLRHIAPCFQVRTQKLLLCTRQLNQGWLGVLPKMSMLSRCYSQRNLHNDDSATKGF